MVVGADERISRAAIVSVADPDASLGRACLCIGRRRPIQRRAFLLANTGSGALARVKPCLHIQTGIRRRGAA